MHQKGSSGFHSLFHSAHAATLPADYFCVRRKSLRTAWETLL